MVSSSSKFVSDDAAEALNSVKLANTIAGIIIDEFKKEEEQDGKIRDKLSEFLNNLEMEAVKEKRPVLVIRGAEKLFDVSLSPDTKHMFQILFERFDRYSNGRNKVSIIMESRKYLMGDIHQYVRSPSCSFRFCRVDPWSKEIGYHEVVERYKIFTKEEYERVWDTVGGHAGQMDSLHTYLRQGLTLTEAIQHTNSQSAVCLKWILVGQYGSDYDSLIKEGVDSEKALQICIQMRRELLTQLVKSNFFMSSYEVPSDKKNSLKYLCESNVLWIDISSVIPLHQTYRNAIELRFGLDITLSKAKAYNLVVNKFQLLTADEYEKGWNTTGGNIGQLLELHFYLKRGESMNEAMRNLNDDCLRVIYKALYSENGPDYDSLIGKGVDEYKALQICVQHRRDLLKQLAKSNFSMACDNVSPEQKLTLKYLCASSLLQMYGNYVIPFHQTFRNVMEMKFGSYINLSKAEAYNLVVNKFQLLTADEYEKAWNTTGGNIGQLFELHRLLKRGESMNEARNNLNDASLRVLYDALYSENGPDYDSLIGKGVDEYKALQICVQHRRDLLKQLAKSNFSMACDNVSPEQKLTLKYLCASSLLQMYGNYVIPFHQTFRNVMEMKFGSYINLSKAEAYNLVVNKFQLLTADEYEKAWNTTGGNIGQLFELHRLLKRGESMNEARNNLNDASLRVLYDALYSENGPDYDSLIGKGADEYKALRISICNRRNFLTNLQKRNYAMTWTKISLDHNLSFRHFCASEVLEMDGLNIVPFHRTMENAIEKYLRDEEISSVSLLKYFKSFWNFFAANRLGVLLIFISPR